MATTPKNQKRDEKRKTFAPAYSYDALRRLLAAVAPRACPAEPKAMTQAAFNGWAPRVAEEQGLPEPPQALAVYVRLNKRRREQGLTTKSWATLVEEALRDDPVVREKMETRRIANFDFDEATIYFSLRRIADYLGKTPTRGEYEQGHQRLLAEERARRRGGLFETVLLTVGQIENACGGWPAALQFAELERSDEPSPNKALDPLPVYRHFYESQGRFPGWQEFAGYARHLEIALPRKYKTLELKKRLIAERAADGKPTPKTLEPDERMSASELEQLIAGYPRIASPGHWTLERTLEVLAGYVAEAESQGKNIRQSDFREWRKGKQAPTQRHLTELAIKHDIGSKDDRFQALIEKARELVRARRAAEKEAA